MRGNEVIHQSRQFGIIRKWRIAVLALVFGLAVGTAQAADLGSREHAEGRYDAGNSTYLVVRGDELDAVAERFGVSLKELMKVNKLSSTEIEFAQTLAIPAPVHVTGKLDHPAPRPPYRAISCLRPRRSSAA
jgi:hypothetical protein